MGGDLSNDTFDSIRDHAEVLLQQGRPITDADWNEMVRTLTRRLRAGTVDTIGRAVVPRETPRGFEVAPLPGGGLGIGRGRMYLGGRLIECHGLADFDGTDASRPTPVLDRKRVEAGRAVGVLDERVSPPEGDALPYESQPYWPVPAALPVAGRHLAYVEAWEREVTALHDPRLLEPALGGIDTTLRTQNAWQVRLTPVGVGATCATSDAGLESPGWEADAAPSTARLSIDTIDVDDPEDPCLVPPTEGYTGLENQLYRVELHAVGAAQADARFKWSRENASVASAVEAISAAGDRVTVGRIGRDRLLAFREGDWVELTDDRREFDQRSGQMLRVAVVHESTREVEFEGAFAADLVPAGGADTLASRHSRLIRWDQRGVVRAEDGSVWADLDALGSDGLIPVPPAGTRVMLEAGIVAAFDTAPGAGRFREMDFWRFAARTAATSVDRLRRAPPDGIHRHRARLAVLEMPGTAVGDCRVFWPPAVTAGEGGCGCTVCVTPEGHASGALTIQAAIDSLPPEGGTVCLEAGTYPLREGVRVIERTAVAIRGQGALTVLDHAGDGPAVEVRGSVDVTVDRLSVLLREGGEATAGILAVHTTALSLSRIAVVAPGTPRARTLGLGLAGLAIGLRVEDCLFLGSVALGRRAPPDGSDDPAFLIAAEARVAGCVLFGAEAGIRIDGLAANLGAARFDRNLVAGAIHGAEIAWFETAQATTVVAGGTLLGGAGEALRLGCGQGVVEGCVLSAGEDEKGDGLALVDGPVGKGGGDVRVAGNRIGDLGGTGIAVRAALGRLVIEGNAIRRCGRAGIAFAADAGADWLAVEGNAVEDVARAREAGVGILAHRVRAGRVVGNRVARVGPEGEAPGTYVGIGLMGVGEVAVEGNHVSEMATGSRRTPAGGIVVRAPYAQVLARGNQVTAPDRPRDDQSWTAIEIGAPVAPDTKPQEPLPRLAPAAPVLDGFEGPLLADLESGGVLISPAGFSAVGRRQAQVTVSSNQVEKVGTTIRPLLSVIDGTAAQVVVEGNQARLPADGEAFAVAFVEAGVIACAHNVLRRGNDNLAVLLSTGRSGRATVLGNLTMGNIELVPLGLGPPFAALNLLA